MMKSSIYILLAIAAMCVRAEVVVEVAGPLGERGVREAAQKGGSEGAADSVAALYRAEGYLFAKVTAAGDTIKVDAGPRAIVDAFSVVGFPAAMPETRLREGGVFRGGDLEADMEQLVSALEDRGFPFARADIDSFAVDEKARVRIRIAIDSGDSVTIGALVLPKKTKTKTYVVERTMLLKLPEVYSRSRIESGIERLDKLCYLTVSGEPDILLDESGVWLLSVDVVEGRTIAIDGVLGYAPRGSGGGGLSGQLNAVFKNLWGTGRELSLHWNQSADEYLRVRSAFTEPWLFGGRGAMTISGRYYGRDSTFTEKEFSLEYRLPVSFTVDISLGGAYRGVLPDSAGQASSGIPKSSEFRLDFGCSIEKLRPRVNPRRGYDAHLVASPTYIERRGPDELFATLERYEAMARIEGDFSAALPVGRSMVAFGGIHGRSAQSGGPLPLSEHYYMGGWGSLRGYREEQFSAEHLGWGNLEWRVLFGNDAHAFAFADGGVVRPSGGDYEFKMGYGLGLRMSTAVGRWSVAYGIAGGESLTAGMIHVGLMTEL